MEGHFRKRINRLLLATAVLLTVVMMMAEGVRGGGGYCKSELLALSPCLPYVASAPNNVSSSVSPLCCGPVVGLGSSWACLCHLLQQPSLLGFPLNTSRILSLPSLCQKNEQHLFNATSFCQGHLTTAPPPLQSPTGSESPATLGRNTSPTSQLEPGVDSSSVPSTIKPGAHNKSGSGGCLISLARLIIYHILTDVIIIAHTLASFNRFF
ncbi:non-specific lipid transfer protein GPI-anchored 25-like [Magnolia sinica]|uniref:non-specific lipid transfer protein GPI-anchored 25-like n=1 Tax=Magnolia sinica TaxID=86752 RepID=UPI00265AD0AC|nr:non-specific lipid transfer protein GPI-anchored 25-like [Magnolia sinica]